MRPCTKYEPVFGLGLSVSSYPTIGVEDIGVGIGLWVMESWVAGRDDHGALGHSVVGRYGEVLCCEVGDEDDRWLVAEELLNDCICVGEGF